AWNLVEPGVDGADKTIAFVLKGVGEDAHASIRRVDGSHGDTLKAWKEMGSPKYPTKVQIEELRKASGMGPPVVSAIRAGQLRLTLPPMGLAVVEIR
ncbi:MAG: glycosyl hydrolase family 39, partial [Terracidiphilus sp.]